MKTFLYLTMFSFSIAVHGQCSFVFSTTNATCYNSCDGFINVLPSGGTPFQYNWSNGSTNQVLYNLCSGTYTLTMTDSNGCIAIDSVTINAPSEITTSLTLLNSPSSIGACDAEASWSISGGAPPYTIFSWYNCILGTTWPPPPFPIIQTFCTGEYALIIFDGNGCPDTSDCITIVDIANSLCLLNISSINPTCTDSCNGLASVTSIGNAPFQYDWSNGNVNQQSENLCEGSYSVTVTDSQGCTNTESFLITDPQQLVSTATWASNPSNTNSCDGQINCSVLGGEPIYNTTWYDCDTQLSYIPSPGFCSGEYFCVTTDQNGCIDSSECVSMSTLGFENYQDEMYFLAYPNPVSNELSIIFQGNGLSFKEIYVFDMVGRKVISLVNSEAENLKIDCSELPAGAYILELNSENSAVRRKIQVVH